MNYEEQILTYLVDNYRKSKKDTKENKTNRRTQVKPEKIYKYYNSNNGDFEEIDKLNRIVEELINQGFVTVDKEKFGTQVLTIYLVDSEINNIEKYLELNYEYVSKDRKLNLLKNIIYKYENTSPICKEECKLLVEKLNKRLIPKNIEELDVLYKSVAFIENNQEDLYVREVSMKLFGDSKKFEEEVLQPVCALLRKYSTNLDDEENELIDEVLKRYHIYKEPQKLCVKGPVTLVVKGKELDITHLENGFEFSASDLGNIDLVRIRGRKFMTIENRTSYLRYKDDETVIFYLGGYANRDQRDFIKKVVGDNPDITFLHFGDIDAGGFWIHRNLCEITGKEFDIFAMSEIELTDCRYANCLHELTENDRARLQELSKYKTYEEVIKYMLVNNVKLEQEIISYYLMKGHSK